MPSKLFSTQGDFASRVSETIVRYDGAFYYAQPSQDQAFHVTLFTFPGLQVVHENIHVDDDRLNINATKLGLINYGQRVYEPLRVPTRRYRYGTPPEYISTLDLRGGTVANGAGAIVMSQGFKDMLDGRYPTVNEALDTIQTSGGRAQVAVSRFFYLMEDQIGLTRLMFKSDCVLWMGKTGDVNFVEKTTINHYLSRCSKTLGTIVQGLRDYAVRV